MIRKLLFAAFAATAFVLLGGSAQAHGPFGRYVTGGDPYHNGYLYVPPASAYMGVTYGPPIFFGHPAYYHPGSYMGAQYPYSFGPTQYPSGPACYGSPVYGGYGSCGAPYYYPY
jgi:hypothetical protein